MTPGLEALRNVAALECVLLRWPYRVRNFVVSQWILSFFQESYLLV